MIEHSDDALTEREYNERMSVEDQQAHRESVERMLSLDCGQFIEKRGNLTYLSWASAWDRVLREDPVANYHVHQFADGPVQRMPTKGWMVWVDVTIHGLTRTSYLPVMDNRNQALTEPDAFAINKTIQRALAKGIAMHGLGLYVYRGEDVPEGAKEPEPAEPEYIDADKVSELRQLMLDTDTEEAAFCGWLKVDNIEALPANRYESARKALLKKAEKAGKKEATA